MKLRGVGLAVAVALIGAAPAQAAPFTSSLDYAYQLAERHWDAQPTQCVSVDREIVPGGSLNSLSGEAFQPGAGYYGPCYVYIVSDLAVPSKFELACALIRHEYGHLLGYGHSTDPRNIMYPEVTFIPSQCQRGMLWMMNHPRRF